MPLRATLTTSSTDIPASLVTQMFIAEKYGLRLDVKQLAEILGISQGAVQNRISANTFNIQTYIDNGKKFADYRDVAAHFDKMRHAVHQF